MSFAELCLEQDAGLEDIYSYTYFVSRQPSRWSPRPLRRPLTKARGRSL